MRAHLSRRPFLVAFVGLVLAAGGASAGYVGLTWSRVSPASVAVQIDGLLAADSLAGALHPGVHDVYDARSSRPAWFDADARGAALQTLGHADRDGLPIDSALAHLGAQADTAATARSRASLDLAITDALLRYGDALGRPQVDAAALYGHNWTPAVPDSAHPAAALADALAEPTTDPAAALGTWAESLRPQHPGYRRLRARLARELDLAALPVLDRDLAPGDTGATVAHLRDRLIAEGLTLAAGRTFDDATVQALRTLQARHGHGATGRLDGATRQWLNRRRPELVPILQLNLEKWRWLPRDLGDLHVWVNIPRFELALRERDGDDWADAIRFRAVVGASDWQTPVFSDTLETVVFNPTWTVPASIQRESYGRVRGRVVRPPGPGNAMGRVKFLFPNRHSVYVHDTPSKWAFNVDDRARSHGCVRAGDPEGLARELLSRTNGWEAERVAKIFRGSWRSSQWETVERPVPVHLVYFTAEVDPDGALRLFDDVYGRDRVLADALGLELPDLTPDLLATLIADRIGDERAVLEAETDDAPADDANPTPTTPVEPEPTAADVPAPQPARPAPPAARSTPSAPVPPSARVSPVAPAPPVGRTAVPPASPPAARPATVPIPPAPLHPAPSGLREQGAETTESPIGSPVATSPPEVLSEDGHR